MSTTTTAPGLPTRTFGELAAEAVHLLRARLVRRPVRRRELRAVRLRCLVALVLVAALSTALASVVWNATIDHRLRLVKATESGGRELEVSLEDRTLHRRLEAGAPARGAAAHAARPGSPGTVRGAAGPDALRGGGLAVDGPVLATLSAGASLAAGLLAGRVILRRARRADEGEDVDLDLDVDVDVDLAEEHRLLEPTAKEPTPAEDEQVEDDQDVEVDVEVGAGPDARVAQPEPVSKTAALLSEVAQPATSTRRPVWTREDDDVLVPTRQRLYERRRMTEQQVDLPAQLMWLQGRWAVTVVELSDERFTMRMAERPSVPGRRAPLGAGDHLRIQLPGKAADVLAPAQVVWLRATADGVVAGVRFVGLSAGTLQSVQEICAA